MSSPNKEINSSATDPRTSGAETEIIHDSAAWRKKVEDDNAFLRNQVAAIQSSVDLLLTRLTQPTAEQPFIPRREGPWIVDGNVTFIPLLSLSPFHQQQTSLIGGEPLFAGPCPG